MLFSVSLKYDKLQILVKQDIWECTKREQRRKPCIEGLILSYTTPPWYVLDSSLDKLLQCLFRRYIMLLQRVTNVAGIYCG